MKACHEMMVQHQDPVQFTNSPQMKDMLNMWKNKGLNAEFKEFD
jgi:hypothetical protein